MARKKESTEKRVNVNAEIEGAGIVQDQPITATLETNYLPYAMSVIISRALPEIDGFKPSHRKLLYTMYKMGLLTGARTKSANVVGQTMRLNPHGDAAIYETMVRLGAGRVAASSLCGQQREFRQGVFPRYGLCRFPLYRGQARPYLHRTFSGYRQGYGGFCPPTMTTP